MAGHITNRINELEQSIVAAVRRAHDEFAQNGFDAMAITMTQSEREIREIASLSRRASRYLKWAREKIAEYMATKNEA